MRAPDVVVRADERGERDGAAEGRATVDLGEVQTARPMGAPEKSLAADLANVALKLQSMCFSASVASEGTFPVDHPLLRELSAREREVLVLLAKGTRVPAIAKQLFISQNTVRNHPDSNAPSLRSSPRKKLQFLAAAVTLSR